MYKTEQEDFWSGKFGDAYVERNSDETILASNTALFSTVLSRTGGGVKRVIEFGSNIGINLRAIKMLIPSVECSAIEINIKALDVLKQFLPHENIYEGSILDFDAEAVKEQFDMALIKGVLIHINPEELKHVYEKLYKCSKKYICIAEYYNPTPVEINYRGYENRLFKRDFAGEMMDKFSDLELVDYGFVYHRDNNFPQDDITWFLLKKAEK